MTIWQDKRIVVFGAGASGLACARYFAGQLSRAVTLMDANTVDDEIVSHQLVNTCFGDCIYSFEFTANDVLVVSPGIALTHEVVKAAKAAGALIGSDVESFLYLNKKPVIGITGSNGKTTVTAMADAVLKAMNVHAVACGNIGLPVMQAILDSQADVFVVELSSFQLERLPEFSVDIAALLNVSEDHMDRYESFEDYVKVKQRLLTAAKKVIVNKAEPNSDVSNVTGSKLSIGFSNTANDYDVCAVKVSLGYDIYRNGQYILNSQQLKIQGRHNVLNTLAVIGLLDDWITDVQLLVDGLVSFSGLPHRCQWIATIGGVDYINDSKATNVGATVAALESYGEQDKALVLIAGGQGKDGDFSLLKPALQQYVSHVVLVGEDAQKIADECELTDAAFAQNIEEAVRVASSYQNESIVMLSPACASFDMFKNYQARGEAFIQAVQKIGVAA